MYFERPDCVEYLHLLSQRLKVKLAGNACVLPPGVGSGFAYAEKIPCGITVLVSDTVLDQDMLFTRYPSAEQYFSLQFNEYINTNGEKAGNSLNKNKFGDQLPSAVRLTHTFQTEEYHLPKGVRLQTVRFFFNKSHLTMLLGKEAMEEMLGVHFPKIISNDNLDPIATDYRVTLNELLHNTADQPLRLNFLQNRVLLLLEKFIINLHQKKDANEGRLKRSDEETLRLMKVEALLVQNFSVPPPTIDELARIAAMSPTKLKNDFKTLYGLPIYVYYQKNRMLKARQLLLLGKYSIKEVGIMVGYTNLSHFATTFKKEFGILPSELSSKDGVLIYNS